MSYIVRDWTPRIAYPVGGAGGYSEEQFAERQQAKAPHIFTGRFLFTDEGYSLATRMVSSSRIFAYVHVLHTFSDAAYDETGWPLMRAEGELLRGTALLNEAGEPAVRWRAEDPSLNAYHTDPALVDPAAWAKMVAEFVLDRPVAGLFLDYLAEAPWTYPDDPPLHLTDNGLAWKTWQVQAVFHLRRELPGIKLIANGKWALTEPGWTRGGLLDGVFAEACGTLWMSPSQACELLRAHKPGSMLILDAQQGTRWHLEQVAPAVSAATGWYWSENWRSR